MPARFEAYLPAHFHVTEVGLVTKHFSDCGGVERILGREDLDIEAEYQQATIGKFGLAFDGQDFVLTPKQTACLAQDACGIPNAFLFFTQAPGGCCTPGGGCC